jgi:hypothetical protein
MFFTIYYRFADNIIKGSTVNQINYHEKYVKKNFASFN